MKVKKIFKKTVAGILTITLCMTGLFTGTGPFRADAASRFSDTAGHWGETAINRAADMGMIKGDGKGRYNPDANITRAEFVSILNNIFGATVRGDISVFSDVQRGKWYYENIQKAYFMETIWGMADGALRPEDPITREDAIVGIAKAMELSSDNTSVLNKFTDGTAVTEDAKKSVAAMVSSGYINGSQVGGGKNPQYALQSASKLTRAEIAAIFTNMITEIYTSNKTYGGHIVGKSMVVNTPDAYISGLTVNGDLVLGDGVGSTGATIENTTVKGRLIIRGGGTSSVYLMNTVVEGGTLVNSLSTDVRIVSEGIANPGIVSAKTGTILEGSGFVSLQVPASAREGSAFRVSNAQLESVDINAPNSVLTLEDTADVTNVRFSYRAGRSSMDVARGAQVDFLGVSARDVIVTGSGDIEELQVNATGFDSEISPDLYNIANNISAVIGGRSRSGSSISGAGTNEVIRDTEEDMVHVEIATPSGFGSKVVPSSTSNIAYLTPKNGTRIQMSVGDLDSRHSDNKERHAYWLEVHVPSPRGTTADVVQSLDGELKLYDYDVEDSELILFVPITKEKNENRGSINQRFYIKWRSDDEVLDIRANNIPLAELSASDENMLIGQFNAAIFTGCDGTQYTGSEAIKRLLLTDNPLGLDLRGYKAYDEADQNYVAVKMAANKNLLTSRAQIQSMLLLETSRKGALYLINNSTQPEEIRDVVEDQVYAQELTIDTSEGSRYSALSQRGRIEVGKEILKSKKSEYTDAATFKKDFEKAVDTVLKKESTLLDALNAAANGPALQKVYETPANAALLGLALTREPYTLFPKAQKDQIAASAYSMLPFADLDEARDILLDLMGAEVDESLVEVIISSVILENNAATLTVGDIWSTTALIRTSNGDITATAANSTITVDKPSIAEASGVLNVTGRSKGTAKVTVTSKEDPKKSASATVKVVDTVSATNISLDATQKMIAVGDVAAVNATLTPPTSTDKVTWGSEDSGIASVAAADASTKLGNITGESRGITNISARTPGSSQVPFCEVIVLPDYPDILLDKEEITIGVGGEPVQIRAFVAPITAANKTVTWKSSDAKTVTVDANGFIKGAQEGTAVITATSKAYPEVEATCNVTVDSSGTVLIDETNITMFANGIQELNATVFPEDGAVTWRSENPNIVKVLTREVTKSAIIQAEMEGTTQIFATTPDGSATASCKVTVAKGKPTITFKPNSFTMSDDPSDQVMLEPTFTGTRPTNTKIDWRIQTGNTLISVTSTGSSGLVKAIRSVATASGSETATIIGVPQSDQSGASNLTATIKVTTVPVTEISMRVESLTIRRGQILEIPYDLLPANASNKTVNWKSVNDQKVLALNGQSPYDTAATRSRIEGKETTEVRTTYTAIDKEAVWMWVTSSGAMYETKPSDTAIVTVWKEVYPAVTHEAIQYVNTPVRVNGTTPSGKSTYFEVTVLDRDNQGEVSNIRISLDKWVYKVGEEEQQIIVRFNVKDDGTWSQEDQPSNTTVRWTSSNNTIAYVQQGTNYLVPLKAGVVNITATSEDGAKTDTKTIVVAPAEVGEVGYTYEADKNYGDWIDMDMSKYNTVTITKSSGQRIPNWTGSDAAVRYTINEIDKDKKILSTNAGILTMDSLTGLITAKAPGLFKVTVRPLQEVAYGMAAPNDASQVIYNDTNPLANPVVSSLITITGGAFYGPNDKTKPLDPSALIPLVIKNQVYLEGKSPNVPLEFYVRVKPAPVIPDATHNNTAQTGLELRRMTGGTQNLIGTAQESVKHGESFTVRVIPNPANATIDMSSFSIVPTAPYVTLSAVRGPEVTGGNYAEFEVIGAQPGTTPITVSFKNVAQKDGLPGVDGGYQTDTVPAVEAKGTFTVNVGSIPAASLTLTPPVSTATNGAWYIGDEVNLNTDSVVTILPQEASINAMNIAERVVWTSNNAGIATVQNGLLKFTGTGAAIITATLRSANQTTPENSGISPASITLSCVGVKSAAGGTGADSALDSSANGNLGAGVQSLRSNSVTPIADEAINTALENVPDHLKEMDDFVTVVPDTVAAAEKKDQTDTIIAPSQAASQKARLVKALTTDTENQTPITAIQTRPTASVLVGETLQLMPVVTPALADTRQIKWTSSDTKVATVDENGIVTGLTAGKSVKITATTASGKSDVTTVNVKNPSPTGGLLRITLNKTEMSLNTGAQETLIASYQYAAGTTVKIPGITWYSSNDAVAVVDQTGVVKAVGPGQAYILAVADNSGKLEECRVYVSDKVAVPPASSTSQVTPAKPAEPAKVSMQIVVNSQTMKVGETQTASCTVGPVTWKSSNPRVLTVDAQGVMKAVSQGLVAVTCTDATGKSAATRITVTK